jgi:hypothetical protein
MPDRIGAQKARATRIVRHAPGSECPPVGDGAVCPLLDDAAGADGVTVSLKTGHLGSPAGRGVPAVQGGWSRGADA